MKRAIVRTPSLTIEVEGNTQKELFRGIAEVQEVFGEKTCGLCNGDSLHLSVRVVDDNDFYEYVCQKCGGRLSLGQSKKEPGKLFPIRKLTREGKPSRKEGEYGKHRGWTKYRGKPVVQDE